jgi:hypothetical protein
MFVDRTRGVLWAAAGVLSLVACSDPSQVTDLRPDGPPEVLSVLVMDDAAAGLLETPTFCKPKDNKRPSLVGTPDGMTHQICPIDLSMGVPELTDANPQNWYVRIMFDELLDDNIEDLVPILDSTTMMPTGNYKGTLVNTQPVTLQCQSIANGNPLVDIPYDGYYSPAGNNVTWPLGPSLVIKPNSPALVATTMECQVTLKSKIVDKDNNPVPDGTQGSYPNERGPYKFKIAPVALVVADSVPAPPPPPTPDNPNPAPAALDPIAASVDVTFNTAIDPTTLVYAFSPDPGNDYVLAESTTEFLMGADFAANVNTPPYTWTIPAGTKIKDQCGQATTFGTPNITDGTSDPFTTNALAFNQPVPFDGQLNAKPSDKIQLPFNQYMNPTTLATNEWSLTEDATSAAVTATPTYNAALTLILDAQLKPQTKYTFTLKGGATIDDCPGGEYAFGGCGAKSPNGGTFTNNDASGAPKDQVIHFTTSDFAVTSITPADNSKVTLDSTGIVTIDLKFNFDANPASLATTEWSLSPAAGTWTVKNKSSGLTTPATVANVIELASAAPVAPGDYTFTLKAGATINDFATTPSTYTQASDLVVHFTVAPAPATVPTPACY